MRAFEVVAIAALAASLGACSQGTFACSDASQCTDGGVAGVCEPSGYCSFPEESCETGQRYGKHAPSGLAETCVPPGGNDSQTTALPGTETDAPSSGTSTSDPTSSGSGATTVGVSAGGSSSGPGDDETTEDLPDCAPTWIQERGTHLPTIRFDTTGNLLVMGNDGSEGSVMRMSTCDGETTASISLSAAGAEYVRPMHAEPDNDAWVVVGNRVYEDQSSREAFVAQLDLEDLTPQWIETLPSPMEEAWKVALLGDTRWVVGVSNFTAGMAQPYMAHANASGDTCGFPVDPAGFGYTRAMAVYGPDVYVAGSVASRAYIARFDSQACGVDPCSCTPDWSMDFAVQPDYTELRGLVMLDGTLYAAGYSAATDNVDFEAFVARVEPPSTEVAQLWTYNPTPLFDAVIELYVEDDTLFAPMTTGFNIPQQDSSAAVGAVAALPLDLEQPETWIAQVPQTTSLLDVVADDESVYLVGRQHSGTGYVVKCTRDGDCPQ